MHCAPVRIACAVGAILGEGPVWVTRDRALWFVDIKQRRLYRFDPAAATLRSWTAPMQIGWALPARRGGFVVGLQSGLARFDPDTGEFDDLIDPEPHLQTNRLNDATTDREGRIWLGSMDDGETDASGRVHVYERGRVRDAGLPSAVITNGPAFSPNGATLYHTDTLGRTIHAVPVNDDATLGKARVLIEIEPGAGWPDGPVVDSAGCIWTGLFGGWGVRRYSPEGTLIAAIALPTANITKVAFGGDDLKTVYATSARKGLDAAALAAQPNAGDLFAFETDVAGLSVIEVDD